MAATKKTRADSQPAARAQATKSPTDSQPAPRTRPKSPAKRFRVRLEHHGRGEAVFFRAPFDAQKLFGTRARVAVKGTINGFPFRSSIFPEGGGTHYMVVNREVREGAGVKGGDTVSVVLERDDEPRTVEPPADFLRALRADRAARETWERLSYTHRKEHVRAVEDAKRPETRARRIEKSISMLAAGKKEFY